MGNSYWGVAKGLYKCSDLRDNLQDSCYKMMELIKGDKPCDSLPKKSVPRRVCKKYSKQDNIPSEPPQEVIPEPKPPQEVIPEPKPPQEVIPEPKPPQEVIPEPKPIKKITLKPPKEKPPLKPAPKKSTKPTKAETQQEIVDTYKIKPTKEAKKEAILYEKKRPVHHKKTQCTKEWAEKKAKKGKILDILATCGTKRIREYAQCFDPDYLNNINMTSKDCVKAKADEVKDRKIESANSPGFNCAKTFAKSCFEDLRLMDNKAVVNDYNNYVDNWKDDFQKTSKYDHPTKREFCANQWKDRKDDFITTDIDGKKKLNVNLDKCVIEGKK